MPNDFFNRTNTFTKGTLARADTVSSEFTLVETGFNNVPAKADLDLAVYHYAADSGAANAYIVTLSPAPAAYADGMEIRFKATNANTGASTINVNALGAKAIIHPNGDPLIAGDIAAAQQTTVIYNATAGNFQLHSHNQNTKVYADAAAASQTAAAASASAASTSETNAATSASTATTQAGIATTQAGTATTQAGIATTQAGNASTSASNAASSATTADLNRGYAQEWANKAASSLVSAAAGGDQIDDFSALHWSVQSANSASAASTSASNASTSASNAATSASTASTQASNAATSASNAATSASNAATSETNAAASAAAAAASAANGDLKVSANDTTLAPLISKLTAGTSISVVETNDGGNETVTINYTGVDTNDSVKISANDTTTGFLNGKLVAGSNITLTELNDGLAETLQVNVSGGAGSGLDADLLDGQQGSVYVNQNAFSNLAVSGQSTLVADTATDTLTFANGGGLSIATTLATDTVTFTVALTDGTHGNRGGGSLHAPAVAGVSDGFISASDKSKLDGIAANAEVNQNAWTTIAVSGQLDVVADTKTDTLTLVAGGATTLLTSPAGDSVTIFSELNQNAFSNIAVAGQSTVAAEIDTDTVTFAASTGMSITTDAVSDIVTFAVAFDDGVHGSRGGGALHSAASVGSNGFMSSTDKSKLDGIASGAQVNQNAFANIAVSGQSTVAADSVTDTVTYANGTGITITTNATTDTVTFSINTATVPTLSATNTFTGNQYISGANPFLGITETDATANNQRWRIHAISESLQFSAVNDAESAASNWCEVNRTGTTIDTVNFPNGVVQAGGIALSSRHPANLYMLYNPSFAAVGDLTGGASIISGGTGITAEVPVASSVAVRKAVTSSNPIKFGNRIHFHGIFSVSDTALIGASNGIEIGIGAFDQATVPGFGVRVNNSAGIQLYSVNVSRTLATAVTGAAGTMTMEVAIDFTPGVNVTGTVKVNGGSASSLGTITTNLPSGNSSTAKKLLLDGVNADATIPVTINVYEWTLEIEQ